MWRYRNLYLVVSLILVAITFSTPAARAQANAGGQQQQQRTSAAAPAVTASTTLGHLRVASPEQSALRLEIYSESGARLFDTDFRPGSILDFVPADAGQTLADGTHLLVVTTRDVQGRLRQRLGALRLEAGRVAVSTTDEERLGQAQARALAEARASQGIVLTGPAPSVAVIDGQDTQALTVAMHDGRDGQITSTAGALTLRTGDVFKGAEVERVRVTEDGRVGIGTAAPEAALDVAGEIRTSGGIRFADGTLLRSANGAGGGSGGGGHQGLVPSTPNILAKFSDADGAVVNSTITEDASGNIGIGTNAPGGAFDLKRTSSSDILQRVWNAGAGGAKLRYVAGTGATSQMQFTDGTGWLTSIANNRNTGLQFRVRDLSHPNSEAVLDASTRMTILGSGNVGIGTTTPTSRLQVVGDVRLTGAGSGVIFPDGSKLTSATGTSGPGSGTGIISAINSDGTAGFIGEGRLSPNVARLGGANAWSGANVFGAGLSANNALVTNVGNPVNAGDATNKAYVDANFVKFVPGAEQLSVGDANGTATMINLRGGSTCCSGPGGHTPAFFKVFQNGSFVATGNLGIGTSPMEGKGYRTSWHTYKGAFRSGYADNEWDDANVGFFSWAGGSNSTASGLYALAFGDTNFARSTSSIAFGSGNEVKGAAGFSAGAGNRVCDTYGVALGNNARSGGPYIDGKCDPETFNIRGLAAVAIGYNVTADQDHTMALGKFASNNGFQGTFIWSDGAPQASADTFRNTANNEFAVRATGGLRFRTNLGGTTGCNLPAGSGVFNCTSSRTTKENFSVVDGNDVLARMRKVPVSTWNYITEGSQVRHLGPMAEDFHSAFRLGTDEKSIGVLDIAGVSFAAVKALDARTSELQTKTEELQRRTAEVELLRSQVQTLEQRLAALEEALKTKEQK